MVGTCFYDEGDAAVMITYDAEVDALYIGFRLVRPA